MVVVQTVTAEPSTAYELTVVEHDALRSTICAVGEFDLAARNDLAHALRQQGSARRRIIRLDLSKVTFLDCPCLGVLIAAHHRLLQQHGLLILTGVSEAVARIIRITGMDDTLSGVSADQDPFGSTMCSPQPILGPHSRLLLDTEGSHERADNDLSGRSA